ncbi:hypothetical protein SteCoe_825 [Stentor coeruleus]|uniref:Uncharacterized protein n=1 Tax=Stentor coeruleus TaxID=5963 RepID=A0A1R2D3F9_9CILI|nr:hypothetical protein SteCoe_825 [Stentor coeruleus]
MNEQLKEYLENSKESRIRLRNKAKNYQKALNAEVDDIDINKKRIDFPTVSPKRFKEFKEEVHNDLKRIFIPEQNTPHVSKKYRALSDHKSMISSVYNLDSYVKKKISFLPPVRKSRDSSVVERLLSRRITEQNPEIQITPIIETPKKSVDSRFTVKKMLLIPVLKNTPNRLDV